MLRKAGVGLLLWLACSLLLAQNGSPSSSGAQDDPNAPELTTHEEATTFKVNVKLVLVRAVVRDAKGNAIGGLHKEDFELLDNGKPQTISQFEAETPKTMVAPPEAAPAEDSTVHRLGTVPARYIAYVFDDQHMELKDVETVREAARRHFQNLRPNDRAGLFTTSGKTVLDFTDDLAQLDAALQRMAPVTGSGSEAADCPDISYYEADLIVNKGDQEAVKVAKQQFLQCTQLNSARISKRQPTFGSGVNMAPDRVASMAQGVLARGDAESRQALQMLQGIVSRMSVLPGQRSVVLVSPGFLTPTLQYEFADLVDKALHAQVIVNSIDARGVYALNPGGDVKKRLTVVDPDQYETFMEDPAVLESQYATQAALEQSSVLAGVANDTGGQYFHGNDFNDEFKRAAEAPEYSYILAFAPQDLKSDGKFHELKVTLKNGGKVTIASRKGYFAPKSFASPAEQAKQEMREALFSQQQLHDLPVEMHTQFFKASEVDAKVTVLAHVDVQRLHFRKLNGRNNDVLTCDTALFNGNGNLVQGLEKTVTMKLKDETLEHKLGSGITLKTSFDLKPGTYLLRLVVRDSEGQLMSAETRPVEIP